MEKSTAESTLGYHNPANVTRLAAAAHELFQDLRRSLCQCDEAYCAYCSWLDDAQQSVNKALGLP